MRGGGGEVGSGSSTESCRQCCFESLGGHFTVNFESCGVQPDQMVGWAIGKQ